MEIFNKPRSHRQSGGRRSGEQRGLLDDRQDLLVRLLGLDIASPTAAPIWPACAHALFATATPPIAGGVEPGSISTAIRSTTLQRPFV